MKRNGFFRMCQQPGEGPTPPVYGTGSGSVVELLVLSIKEVADESHCM